MQDLNQYRCEHFRIEELVSPKTHEKYGERAWQFLDVHLLMAVDLLREDFGVCVINDWFWGGKFSESCLRSFDYGGLMNHSLHKMGKAADLKFRHMAPKEIRKRILANPKRYWMIKGVELKTPTWLHIDTRNVDTRRRFFTFNP